MKNKKLQLNKETIAQLNNTEKNSIYGGVPFTSNALECGTQGCGTIVDPTRKTVALITEGGCDTKYTCIGSIGGWGCGDLTKDTGWFTCKRCV